MIGAGRRHYMVTRLAIWQLLHFSATERGKARQDWTVKLNLRHTQ